MEPKMAKDTTTPDDATVDLTVAVAPIPEVPPAPAAAPVIPEAPIAAPAPAIADVMPAEYVATLPAAEINNGEMVTVTVPQAFELAINHATTVSIKPGIQQMLLDHAKHWYAIANGVEIYEAK